MKINEIAHKLNISTRAIRYYEEAGLITPQKLDNQYRIFSEKDAWRLQTIVSLREVGMTVEDIKTVLGSIDQRDNHEVQFLLEIQRSVIFSQWVELKQLIRTLDQMIGHLNQEQSQALGFDDIYQLAEGSRKLRKSRKDWKDRWDFDQLALAYDERNVHQNYEEALDLILNQVSPIPGEIGLDLGTGTGNLAARFLNKGNAMFGIDQSREMLNQCRRKYPLMETKVGNLLAIPYFDARFDFVVTSYALHHLKDDQKILALEEMNRVLKPHGRLCIADLMFENDAIRQQFLHKLTENGQFTAIQEIEDEYYANCSLILHWLDNHGFITKHQQMNDLLHIVYAVKLR